MKQTIATIVFCASALCQNNAVAQELTGLKSEYSRPQTIPFPVSAPYSPQVATLGKMLFFDPRLSGGENISCSTCHNPSFGWEVPVKTPLGAMNTRLKRHTPTIINSAWGGPFFWDGHAETLEQQAAGPISASDEMDSSLEEIVARLSRVRQYEEWFNELFPGKGLSPETILTSLATYERTIVAGWSPFDRWIEGDDTAISPQAVRGFMIFNGKARCSECHTGWNFTDHKFHRNGVPTDDVGREMVESNNPAARYAFKTPSLRNISLRAPYMHNGAIPDLTSLVEHYSYGGVTLKGLGNDILPFAITPEETSDLLSFLMTLTDRNAAVATPILPAN